MNGESDRVKTMGEDNDEMQGGVAHKCACRITPFCAGSGAPISHVSLKENRPAR